MELQQMIDVLKAAQEGKEIEFRRCFSKSDWAVIQYPDWDFDNFEYRIAPEQPKKKVKKWQWVYGDEKNQQMTHGFYKNADQVKKAHGLVNARVIQRADWTEIEVEE